MARHIGKNAVIQFGSTVLTPDYRTFKQAGSADLIETTAGADSIKSYIVGATDGGVDLEMVKDGTTIWNAVAPGTEGTLSIGSEGTTGGLPKTSGKAVVTKREQ